MSVKRVLFVWPKADLLEVHDVMPLGLGYLCANLSDRFKTEIWDAKIRDEPNEKLIDYIYANQPDIVGFSIWSFNYKIVKSLVSQVKKEFKDIVVVVGGPEVSAQRGRILEETEADYAITGDGENPFSRLLDIISENDLSTQALSGIEGIVFRDDRNEIISRPPAFRDISEIKYCNYEKINFAKYLEKNYSYGMHPKNTRTAPIMTTRGCPYSCNFCTIPIINGRKIRRRSIKSIIDEICYLYEKYEVRGITIIDDNFNFGFDYAKEFCREIINLGLEDLSFDCNNGVRINYLDEELLSTMKQAGWRCIVIAPESGSIRTLKKMNKKIDLDVVSQKISLIKKKGFILWGFFIIGYPGETAEDIKETIRFACKEKFDGVSFHCFHPLSGTPAFNELVRSGEIDGLDYDADFLKINYAPRGMTINKLKLLRLYGLFRFYGGSFNRVKWILSDKSLSRVMRYIYRTIVSG